MEKGGQFVYVLYCKKEIPFSFSLAWLFRLSHHHCFSVYPTIIVHLQNSNTSSHVSGANRRGWGGTQRWYNKSSTRQCVLGTGSIFSDTDPHRLKHHPSTNDHSIQNTQKIEKENIRNEEHDTDNHPNTYVHATPSMSLERHDGKSLSSKPHHGRHTPPC